MTDVAHTIRRKGKRKTVADPSGTARQAIGVLAPGDRLTGITKGQFSLIDIIKAVLESTGPAHLVLSTWTSGIKDIENVGFLINRGDLLSLRMLAGDGLFYTQQKEYCDRIIELFGEDALCFTSNHAKFAVIHNDTWNVVVRSSMNLNRNRRFEQFDLDEDAELVRFFLDHVDEIYTLAPHGAKVTSSEVLAGFKQAMNGENVATGKKQRTLTYGPLRKRISI